MKKMFFVAIIAMIAFACSKKGYISKTQKTQGIKVCTSSLAETKFFLGLTVDSTLKADTAVLYDGSKWYIGDGTTDSIKVTVGFDNLRPASIHRVQVARWYFGLPDPRNCDVWSHGCKYALGAYQYTQFVRNLDTLMVNTVSNVDGKAIRYLVFR